MAGLLDLWQRNAAADREANAIGEWIKWQTNVLVNALNENEDIATDKIQGKLTYLFTKQNVILNQQNDILIQICQKLQNIKIELEKLSNNNQK